MARAQHKRPICQNFFNPWLPLGGLLPIMRHAVPGRRANDVTDPADSAPAVPATPATLRLRILCTTDLHAHVWPHDYQTDRPTKGRGLAALATLITAARAEAGQDRTLLVDCGDILQGTALGDWAALQSTARINTTDDPAAPGPVHPMIRAMNHLRYDAAALGNHDLNYGLDPMTAAFAGADFPVLCANLVADLGATPPEDTPIVPPWCILDRQVPDTQGCAQPLRIGLIGTAPPQSAVWDAAVLRGRVAARDAAQAVRAHLPALHAAGCDLVIALSHAGIGSARPAPMEEDTSLAVARIDGIDVVLAGHSHRRLPGPDFHGTPGVDAAAGRLAGKPAAMAGAFGSDLGVLDLALAARPGGGWRLAAADVSLRPVKDTAADPAVLDLTAPAHRATRGQMGRIVGHSRTRLHSVFALTGRAPALALLAEAQAAHARRLVTGTALDGLPLLSAAAPFKHGGPTGPDGFVDIPAGQLRHRHMVELSPFPNQLCVLAVTGADLRAWLERAASAYCTVPRGARDATLIDPAAAAYTFDEIHGLTYTLDLSRPPLHDAQTGRALTAAQPPASSALAEDGAGWTGMDGTDEPQADRSPRAGRVTALYHAGRAIADTDRFAVATNSYRASGGGGYGMIPKGTPRIHSREPLLDLLLRHVAGAGEIATDGPAPHRFAPLGATALLRTAPQVTLDDHGDPDRKLAPLGLDGDGYGVFRLFL
jgi:2',3'-cyclic-nucleotide 2'-phosphodiesterase/3'-nucleotidase